MNDRVILLSVPGLQSRDLAQMPRLRQLAAEGDQATLVPGFPCVTCPVQANMTTGYPPSEHGVIANGFFWRERGEVQMWTAWNDCIERPQIWDILREHDQSITSAVWFPLHSKGCGADYVCTPAPVHNPDGSESLWCYTKPTELYGALRDALGHFPLQHFWGPLANIRSTDWIVDSADYAAKQYRPRFQYIYLPHLDYAAQKHGPESPQAIAAIGELDDTLGRLIDGEHAAFGGERPLWLVAGEYSIVPVDHVSYPNRVLRQAGLLDVRDDGDGEQLDIAGSRAWALVDHQFSHVFARDRDSTIIDRLVDLFRRQDGIAEVLTREELTRYELTHERAGDVVLVSSHNSWQAYYWWLEDERAPRFARTVDIHKKPGYDPVELFIDPATRGIPLDATLVRGSHGAPPHDSAQRTVLLSSERGVLPSQTLADTDVCDLVLRQFGV